jgi:outer membrane protein assembly factor BamB
MRAGRYRLLRIPRSFGGIILLAGILMTQCGRFTYRPATDPPFPLWPQFGGGPERNAVIPEEPVLPLRQLWLRHTSSAIDPALIGFAEWLVYATRDGRIEGFHLGSEEKLGKIIGRNNRALTCAWGGDGLVIVKRLGRENVQYFDLANGRMRWKRSVGPVLGEPLMAAGRLYLATLRGRILCLALEDGRIVAENKLQHDCLSSPTMADSILTVGDDRGILYGFDSRLRPLWQYETGAALRASPVASQGQILIGSTSGKISLLDALSGRELWHYQSGGKIFHAAAAADSVMVFSSTANRIHGLHRRDGRSLWQFDLAAVPTTSPLICGHTLFIGTADKKLRALSLDDGHEVWAFTAKGRINSPPIVLGNLLLFAAENDLLYCFVWR